MMLSFPRSKVQFVLYLRARGCYGDSILNTELMEAEYLKRTVGSCLADGLAEVAAQRPADPIEYLALWLLKHKENLKFRVKIVSKTSPPQIISMVQILLI